MSVCFVCVCGDADCALRLFEIATLCVMFIIVCVFKWKGMNETYISKNR